MGGRTKGATQYTAEDKEYIKDNWRTSTDSEMAIKLGRNRQSVAKFRCSLGWTRYAFDIKLNSTKALICELYMSGKSLEYIQEIMGKRPYDISMVIIKCLSTIALTDRSKVIVFESKV